MAYTYSKIATVTVGSGGSSSIDFLAIPQNYTDLVVMVSGRSDRSASAADTLVMQLNFDTNSNYNYRYIYGNGASAISSSGSPATFIECFRIPASTATASTFGNSQIYIPNYTSSNYKSISVDDAQENNATTANAALVAGLWNSTAPINSIKIKGNVGNFVQYSTATLYGIKAEV